MSRHHAMHASQANAVLATLHNMDYEEIQDCYGLDIEPTGIVHDNTYNQDFTSLGEWAEWCVANDEMETRGHIHGKAYGALT